ncbi:MAG: hypothetical protein WCD89_23385 [Anaerocolumna sp.]
MSIKANVIGFLGIETYDLILYISKLLINLNQEVLIIDNSETEALTCCIPIPESLNPKISKINYRHIDFVKERTSNEYMDDYDFIFVDFGFKTSNKDIKNCSFIYLVTDKQQHNILRIQNLKLTQEVYLIIKDIIKSENAAYLADNLKENKINVKQYYCLYYDDADKENMISLQYNNDIKFKNQSGQLKELLNQLIIETLHFNKTEVGQAYKKAKRGA